MVVENSQGSFVDVELFVWDLPKLLKRKTQSEPDRLKVGMGTIRLSDLLYHYDIDTREHNNKGYQRVPTAGRTRAVRNAVMKGSINLPTALLLNVRPLGETGGFYTEANNLIRREGRVYLRLHNSVDPNNKNILWVVDGQTRLLGLQQAYEENPESFADYLLPIIVGLGWLQIDEMDEFYTVNANAKSVPVNLAYEILMEMSRDPEDSYGMDSLIETGRLWITNGMELAQVLNDDPTSVWYCRLRSANEPARETTIMSSGFSQSLRPVLNSSLFSSFKVDDQVKILNAYWEGIRLVLPDAFEDPGAYLVQKRIGASVLHGVFDAVAERVRAKSPDLRVLLDPQKYAEILSDPLSSGPGEHEADDGVNRLRDFNSNPEDQRPVTGVTFWKSGQDGAAANFSSGGGVRVLTARLKNLLPPLTFS